MKDYGIAVGWKRYKDLDKIRVCEKVIGSLDCRF